jgi:hypothetical protein
MPSSRQAGCGPAASMAIRLLRRSAERPNGLVRGQPPKRAITTSGRCGGVLIVAGSFSNLRPLRSGVAVTSGAAPRGDRLDSARSLRGQPRRPIHRSRRGAACFPRVWRGFQVLVRYVRDRSWPAAVVGPVAVAIWAVWRGAYPEAAIAAQRHAASRADATSLCRAARMYPSMGMDWLSNRSAPGRVTSKPRTCRF